MINSDLHMAVKSNKWGSWPILAFLTWNLIQHTIYCNTLSQDNIDIKQDMFNISICPQKYKCIYIYIELYRHILYYTWLYITIIPSSQVTSPPGWAPQCHPPAAHWRDRPSCWRPPKSPRVCRGVPQGLSSNRPYGNSCGVCDGNHGGVTLW